MKQIKMGGARLILSALFLKTCGWVGGCNTRSARVKQGGLKDQASGKAMITARLLRGVSLITQVIVPTKCD